MELMWQRYPVDQIPGSITGGFGDWYGSYQHRGTDVGLNVGTPVYAPTRGVAAEMFNDGSYGIAICIEHPRTGWYSLYAHLSRSLVNVGEWIDSGQLIGYSGNTGRSTGPHLHWQVCDSPIFPTRIEHSRDAMLVPFGEPEDPAEEGMTPEEKELLLLASSIIGGWTNGQEFTSIQEALTQLRIFEDRDQRILMGMEILNESLNTTINSLNEHMTYGHLKRADYNEITAELSRATRAIGEISGIAELSTPHEPGANEYNE